MKKNIVAVLPFTQEQKEQMTHQYKDVDFIFTNLNDVMPEQIVDADAILGNIPVEYLKHAKSLKWLQLNSAGYEEYLREDVLKKDVVLTNAGGAYGVAVAEHLLAMLVAMVKKIPEYRDYQKKGEWTDLGQVRPLHDLTVLVIGLGDIGTHFATLMSSLGNKIIGIKNNLSIKPDFVDEVYHLDDVDNQIGQADVVVLSIPANEKTMGFMNKDRFSKMKKDALFFNVGRGSLVDTNALIEALEEEIIAGAGIDVVDIEPLPSNHKLWGTKNLLITPHCSGGFHLPETLTKIQNIAMYNLNQFINEGQFKNKVN